MKYCMFLTSLLMSASVFAMEQGASFTNYCKQQIRVHCYSFTSDRQMIIHDPILIQSNNHEHISHGAEFVQIEIGNFISTSLPIDTTVHSFDVKQKEENTVILKKDTGKTNHSLFKKKDHK